MVRHPTDRKSLERDSDVTLLRASGPGGQHANRRETGVRLVHRPTGTMVTATERRSQKQNLNTAYERLARKIDDAQRPVRKRRATRPTLGSVRRRLDKKRQKSQKKAGRRVPDQS